MGRFSPTERPEYFGGDPGTALAQAFQNHVTQGRLAQQAADQHILSTVEAVRSGYQPPSNQPSPVPAPANGAPVAPRTAPVQESAPASPGIALGRELGGGEDPMAGDPGWGSKVHAPTSLAGVMQAEPSPAAATGAPAAAAAPTPAPSAGRVAGAFDPALGGFAPARITPSAPVPAAAAPSNNIAPPAGRELASAFGGDGRVQLADGGSIDPMAPERRQLGMYGAQQRIAGDERIRGERITREDEFQLAQRSIKARYDALDGIQGITEPQRRAAALDPKVYEELANPYNPNSPAGRAAKLGDETTLARLRAGLDTNREIAVEGARSANELRNKKELLPLETQKAIETEKAKLSYAMPKPEELRTVSLIPELASTLQHIDQFDSPTLLTKLGSRGTFGNFVITPEGQQFNQAADQFLQAMAFARSGKRINDAEIQRLRDAYIPKPGDSEQVLATKRAERGRAVQGLITASGRGATMLAPEVRDYLSSYGAPGTRTSTTQAGTTPAGAPAHPAEQSIDEMIKAGKTDAEIKAALSGRP